MMLNCGLMQIRAEYLEAVFIEQVCEAKYGNEKS